jgi:hypothetical protein
VAGTRGRSPRCHHSAADGWRGASCLTALARAAPEDVGRGSAPIGSAPIAQGRRSTPKACRQEERYVRAMATAPSSLSQAVQVGAKRLMVAPWCGG